MVQYSDFDRVMEAKDHFKNKANPKSLTVSIFLFLFVVNAFGQVMTTIGQMTKEQIIQDIDVLFSTIEEVHPNMYAVYPKEQLDKDIERVKSELEPIGDIFYFYKQVIPFVVKLGDGHTTVAPPFHPNLILFPIDVKVTYPDRVIRVQNDYTQTIPIDAQIMSINNRQANDIVQEMLKYVSGEKDFFRIKGVNDHFMLRMYSLYRDSIFDIEYIFNQEKYSVQVKGLTSKDISEKYLQQYKPVSLVKYAFSILSDKNIGIIEFNSFMDMDRFKVFLDTTFQVLKRENIGNLIIDIRQNGGGITSLGDELFQYISPVPFRQFGKTIVKYSDIQKQAYKTNYDKEVTNPNGIEIVENEKLIELRDNDLRYKGKVFLLTSHYTFSAAASFSWAFKYFNMGTVIGEETGGMAVSFGEIISHVLPNSRFLCSISHKKFYHYGATDDNIHGTLPDYEVEAENALEFTMDLITREK